MENHPEATRNLLGFLILEGTEDGQGLVGAFMVTDERGYPLEFRATTAVRPTAVQRALYGDSLEPYVGTEIVGNRLIQNAQRQPSSVLVPDTRLLDIQNTSRCQVVAI